MVEITEAMVEAAARAIWNIRRDEEDRCDMELEDMGKDHSVWQEARAALEAALSAADKERQIPEGWVMVPIISTWQMEVAGRDVLCDVLDDDASTSDARDAYRAMLSAAPVTAP